MMTNLAQMVLEEPEAQGTRLNRHGPTVLVLIAGALAMLDLTRHVLQDGGVWTDSHIPPRVSARGRAVPERAGRRVFPLHVPGFAALIAGVLWSADLFTKVRDGGAARASRLPNARERGDATRSAHIFYDDDARLSATFLRSDARRKGSGNGARGESMRGRGPRVGTRATFVPRV